MRNITHQNYTILIPPKKGLVPESLNLMAMSTGFSELAGAFLNNAV
jgi:hypothetical protein